MLLRTKMQQHLVGWKNDLPEAWREVFRDVDINLAAIPDGAEIPDDIQIFPGRRDLAINDAPAGAHICRSLDEVDPNQVRVIVLGQDPYPDVVAATGRAFEDGTEDEHCRALRPALCALGQSASELRPGADRPAVCHGREGRAALIRQKFDRLTAAGVLFINSAWTFTRKEDKEHHMALWRPVTSHLLRHLNDRPDRNLVFLLLGGDAQRTVDELRLSKAEGDRPVRNYHPTARNNLYFRDANPLHRVNVKLRALGEPEIPWWA